MLSRWFNLLLCAGQPAGKQAGIRSRVTKSFVSLHSQKSKYSRPRLGAQTSGAPPSFESTNTILNKNTQPKAGCFYLCAPGRIRTCVDRSRQIYSLMHLTALPPTHINCAIYANTFSLFFEVFFLILLTTFFVARFFTSKTNSPSFKSTVTFPPSITPRETIRDAT